MQTELLELKTQLIADFASFKRSILAALVAVATAQCLLVACALIFLK